MHIQFRSTAPAAVRLRRYGLPRLREALRHLEWLVARVNVRLEYVGEGVGRVNKRCRFELIVKGAETIAVDAAGRSWQDSFDAAVAQVRRRVVTHLPQAAQAQPRPALQAQDAGFVSDPPERA
jgi:hypothetical protein